jgi:hypothetical protein
MPIRRSHIVAILFLALVVSGVVAASASARGLEPVTPPVAGLFDFLDPIKNIAELVTKVVSKLFGALAKALMPDFLRDASVDTLKGLVAVPQLGDATHWRNVGQLRAGTTAIAWALLPLPFTLAAVRYLVGTFTDGPHPVMAVVRIVGAAFGLVIYPWAATQAFACINLLTNALLSLPAVGNGLQRAVGVLFGAAIVAGIASPFLACLALVAIVMGTLLFGLKIAIVMIAALLYVAGPLVIALYPLQETSHLYRAWLFAVIALAFIPIGWCLIFAVAGALTLDATSGGISAGLLSKDTTAALAALLAFALAVLWPKVLIGQALHVAAGLGIGLRSASVAVRPASTPARADAATRQLRDGTMTVGRSVGKAAGHLGAPAGGAVGWAGRLMARTAPVPAVTGSGRGVGGPSEAAARTRGGAGDVAGGRFARAAAELAEIPNRLRDGVDAGRSGGSNFGRSEVGRQAASAQGERRSAAHRSAAHRDGATEPRRRSRPSAEQRAVLQALPRDTPPGVCEAVLNAKPGRAAQTATRAAQRAGAPLAAGTRQAVFAAAAGARTSARENAGRTDLRSATSPRRAHEEQARQAAGATPPDAASDRTGQAPRRPRPSAPAASPPSRVAAPPARRNGPRPTPPQPRPQDERGEP